MQPTLPCWKVAQGKWPGGRLDGAHRCSSRSVRSGVYQVRETAFFDKHGTWENMENDGTCLLSHWMSKTFGVIFGSSHLTSSQNTSLPPTLACGMRLLSGLTFSSWAWAKTRDSPLTTLVRPILRMRPGGSDRRSQLLRLEGHRCNCLGRASDRARGGWRLEDMALSLSLPDFSWSKAANQLKLRAAAVAPKKESGMASALLPAFRKTSSVLDPASFVQHCFKQLCKLTPLCSFSRSVHVNCASLPPLSHFLTTLLHACMRAQRTSQELRRRRRGLGAPPKRRTARARARGDGGRPRLGGGVVGVEDGVRPHSLRGSGE